MLRGRRCVGSARCPPARFQGLGLSGRAKELKAAATTGRAAHRRLTQGLDMEPNEKQHLFLVQFRVIKRMKLVPT